MTSARIDRPTIYLTARVAYTRHETKAKDGGGGIYLPGILLRAKKATCRARVAKAKGGGDGGVYVYER